MDVKGTIPISVQQFVLGYFGKDGYFKWLEALPQHVREVYLTKIPPSAWFPLEDYLNVPTEVFTRIFFHGDPRGAWDCGRLSADLAANKFLRLFVRLGTVSILLKRAPDILPLYYKPSSMQLLENARHSALISISRFKDINPLVEHRIGGWIQRAVEISGCKEVEVEIAQSLTRGDPRTAFEITWK